MNKTKLNAKITMLGILFCIPAFCFMIFTVMVPIVWNIALSFTEWNGNTAPAFIGISNYINVLTSSASLRAFSNSIFIALVSTAVAMFLGSTSALLIYRMGKREGSFYRFIFYAPSMMPMSVVGLLFTFILAPDKGLVNSFLGLIGLENLQHAWLADPDTVLMTIAMVSGWRFSGITMILVFSALISIPTSLFEASRLDGSTYFTEVVHIMVPLVKPTLQLTLSLILLSSFRTYDMVYALTRGGPGDFSVTAPIAMINYTFSYNKFGEGATMSVLLTLLVVTCVVIVRRGVKGEQYEY